MGSHARQPAHAGQGLGARTAGAIGPSDDYVIGAAPATTMAMIASQYAAQEAGATKVKVLIMDGGTWDTIVASSGRLGERRGEQRGQRLRSICSRRSRATGPSRTSSTS